MQYGHKEYRFFPFNDLIRYSNYGLSLLPEILAVDKNDFVAKLRGKKADLFGKRYCLSMRQLPYKVIRSFGLFLRPWEMNIIDNIPGNDIFLYDTSVPGKKPKGQGINSLILYHLHGFNYKYLLKGVFLRTILLAKKAWHKYVVK